METKNRCMKLCRLVNNRRAMELNTILEVQSSYIDLYVSLTGSDELHPDNIKIMCDDVMGCLSDMLGTVAMTNRMVRDHVLSCHPDCYKG